MDSPVAKIKERLSIEEIVSSYVKLDRAGANLKAKCPFHNEKTPSFFVSPSRGSYYCFGCGASGDIFTFVEEFEGLDFKGALRLLADKAGVPLERYNQEDKNEKEKLYKIMEETTSYFESNLRENREVLEYLKSRGLTEKSVKDFRVGYALPAWREVHGYLKKRGWTDGEMEKAGLIKKIERALSAGSGPDQQNVPGGFYDRFRGRIMFPINDSSGRVIAFTGRLFEVGLPAEAGAEAGAKYLNSPDTSIFSKSAVLFGLDKAKESIRKNNFSILVEGQIDLILSHQAGYKNAIATSGTALSDSTISKENAVSNLGLIRRLSPNIVLAFDADKAGFNASSRAGRIALSLGMDVKVASMGEGVDPADLISKNGPDAWREAIKNAKHIIEFLLEKVLKNSGDDARKAGRGIKEKVLPYVSMLESSIEKMHFLKKIGELSAIPQSALQDDLKKIEQELHYEKKEIEEAEESLEQMYRKDYILRKLLGIILWQKTLTVPTPGGVGTSTASVGEQSLDIAQILKEIGETLNMAEDKVLDSALLTGQRGKTNAEDLIFEAEVFYENGVDIKKDSQELLLNLKEECLKEELMDKMRELNAAEQKGDKGKAAEIFKECQSLNEKIQHIKNGRLK